MSNKYQEALDELEAASYSGDTYVDKKQIQLLQELVDKEIPKKVRRTFHKDSILRIYSCPCCDKVIPLSSLYCCACGQKLDWK